MKILFQNKFENVFKKASHHEQVEAGHEIAKITITVAQGEKQVWKLANKASGQVFVWF